MRKYIIAGNWKMNGTKESVQALTTGLKSEISTINNSKIEWIVFPPYIFIPEVAKELQNTNITWGAQNFNIQPSGAFTGEISASMLKEFGCRYVLVGHSERRSLYGETDEIVAAKFLAACKNGLIPILCVGETLDERKQNLTQKIIERQLDAVISAAGLDLFHNAVIAYEPVWAIGTGVNAKSEEAEEVHLAIRKKFTKYDALLAEKLQILYGGSLKPDNAKDLLAMPDIDGGLIGGASLKASDFVNIGRAISMS